MIIIILRYKVSLKCIDSCLEAHKQFLKEGYNKEYFLTSGRLVPRIGGVILANFDNTEEAQKFCMADPFYQKQLAEYEFLHFEPIEFDRIKNEPGVIIEKQT